MELLLIAKKNCPQGFCPSKDPPHAELPRIVKIMKFPMEQV